MPWSLAMGRSRIFRHCSTLIQAHRIGSKRNTPPEPRASVRCRDRKRGDLASLGPILKPGFVPLFVVPVKAGIRAAHDAFLRFSLRNGVRRATQASPTQKGAETANESLLRMLLQRFLRLRSLRHYAAPVFFEVDRSVSATSC
jgi:hypothetical protein